MSLLPGQILPPSTPLGHVNEDGTVIIDVNWWLLFYNLCTQSLGIQGGLPASALQAVEATDVDVASVDIPTLARQIANLPMLLPEQDVVPALRDITNALLIAFTQFEDTFSGFANPSAKVGLTAVNGSAATATRSDSAPALDQSISPTWTGTHTFNNNVTVTLDAASYVANSTNTLHAPNYFFERGGTIDAQISTEGTAGGVNTGSAVGDMSVQVRNGGWNVSVNSGTSIALKIAKTTGATTVAGNLSCNNATPPAQVTGWGSPTGASVIANFPGATATLVQCSNVIAKLISDLKAFGLYGA